MIQRYHLQTAVGATDNIRQKSECFPHRFYVLILLVFAIWCLPVLILLSRVCQLLREVDLAWLIEYDERWYRALRLTKKELMQGQHYGEVISQPVRPTTDLPEERISIRSRDFHAQVVDRKRQEMVGVLDVEPRQQGLRVTRHGPDRELSTASDIFLSDLLREDVDFSAKPIHFGDEFSVLGKLIELSQSLLQPTEKAVNPVSLFAVLSIRLRRVRQRPNSKADPSEFLGSESQFLSDSLELAVKRRRNPIELASASLDALESP